MLISLATVTVTHYGHAYNAACDAVIIISYTITITGVLLSASSMAQGNQLAFIVLWAIATTTVSIECPAPGEGFGACIEACSSDSDCSDGQLCCSNGCGRECMPQVEDPCAVSVTTK